MTSQLPFFAASCKKHTKNYAAMTSLRKFVHSNDFNKFSLEFISTTSVNLTKSKFPLQAETKWHVSNMIDVFGSSLAAVHLHYEKKFTKLMSFGIN